MPIHQTLASHRINSSDFAQLLPLIGDTKNKVPESLKLLSHTVFEIQQEMQIFSFGYQAFPN